MRPYLVLYNQTLKFFAYFILLVHVLWPLTLKFLCVCVSFYKFDFSFLSSAFSDYEYEIIINFNVFIKKKN